MDKSEYTVAEVPAHMSFQMKDGSIWTSAQLNAAVPCTVCRGAGTLSLLTSVVKCERCNGLGILIDPKREAENVAREAASTFTYSSLRLHGRDWDEVERLRHIDTGGTETECP